MSYTRFIDGIMFFMIKTTLPEFFRVKINLPLQNGKLRS